MGYIVIAIYVTASFFALFEEKMLKYRKPIFLIVGLMLVLLAGLREVGIDPDSENYEYTYQHYYATSSLLSVEYSFLFISQLLNVLTSNVHALFLLYATFGVGLKMYAISKISKLWFIPLAVYISYYFVMHECMQIRTGILSGMFLLAIKELGDGNRKKALICILIGGLFHYSAIALLPLLFLSSHEISKKKTDDMVVFDPPFIRIICWWFFHSAELICQHTVYRRKIGYLSGWC